MIVIPTWILCDCPRIPTLPGRSPATVKSEEGEHFQSYAHAKEVLFDYIEVFYNQRRHCTLGQISPAECERRTAQAA